MPDARGGAGDAPRALGDALEVVRRDLGLARPDALATVRDAWPELVGPAIASHAQPAAVRDGRLHVVADAPAWAAQLRYLETVIVERLAELGVEDAREGLRVRVVPKA